MRIINDQIVCGQDFVEAVETVIYNNPEVRGAEPFQIHLELTEVPKMDHALTVGESIELQGEQDWRTDYEWTLASMSVKNTSRAFHEPYLTVKVVLDVKTFNAARLFFREPLVIATLKRFKQQGAPMAGR